MKYFLKKIIQVSKQNLLLPFYHMVSNDENSFSKYLYPPRSVENFEYDLDVLLRYFEPITLEELIKFSIQKKTICKNIFHLTFDDGLSNFYEVVAPILKKKNIPATVFVNTDFIDNKKLFYRYKASLLIQEFEMSNNERKQEISSFFTSEDVKKELLAITFNEKDKLDCLAMKMNFSFSDYLKNETPYLSVHQINELIEQGFTVGAHSVNHPLYSQISLKEQIQQTKESLAWLDRKFNLGYRAFSFPFTDLNVSNTFFDSIHPKLDVSFGTSGIKKDTITTNFQRISFELADKNIESFLFKSYLKYLVKIPFGKHKMFRN